MKQIPVFKPSYGKEELEALRDPIEKGWTGMGPKTREFEERFAEHIGVRYAVGMNSGTAALHLALMVMEMKGYEVITTPMTFISTNHAILYNQAVPVFTDIYPDTLNISVEEIEKNISQRTKAIMVVHYGGHPCDMDPILEIAREHNLKVIEDAAHGCGGKYKGRKIGSLGDIACFSFQAVKNLACGEGGMITTNDPKVYKRLKTLRWLGISRDTWTRTGNNEQYSWYYEVEEVGFKYHMSDISATIGLVQLKKLEEKNSRRREIVKKYNEAFANLDWIETPILRDYAKSACHNYVIKVSQRDELNEYLKKKGISTGVHYIPNNHYDIYKGFGKETPIAREIWKRLLTLPLYPDLTDEEFLRIVESVRKFKK